MYMQWREQMTMIYQRYLRQVENAERAAACGNQKF